MDLARTPDESDLALYRLQQRMLRGFERPEPGTANPCNVAPFAVAALASGFDRMRVQVRRIMLMGSSSRERALTLALWERGSMTVGEIATSLDITPPAVTQMIDRLEARGLVSRIVDPSDRRRKLVSVTPQALDPIDPIMFELTRLISDLVATYGEAEAERLVDMLFEIRDVLERATERMSARDDGDLRDDVATWSARIEQLL